ncbi:hypothetical protein KGY64_02465 [Candidatus Bipolaricaulota bacterium]|nr:hypothetical protein [Candidatus Bipolaricaulota bacterium]
MNQKRWFGAILIGIGVLIILGNVGVLENFWSYLGTYWPVLLIVAGLFNIANNPAGRVGGFIVVLAGTLLLLNNLDQVEIFSYVSFWPIILILVGLWFFFRGGREPAVLEKDRINSVALFSGNSSRVVSQDFKGGSNVSMFGGSEIDLRDAQIKSGEAKFDLFAMFGGADVYVPEDWRLVVKGIPLFGGLDDKTGSSSSEEMGPTLVINYLVMFGGIDVKN